jgi:acetone carboxylase gamma subunit
MARMCWVYADAMDCDKQECCDSPLCDQRKAWLDLISIEVKHSCGHKREIRVSIDDAGPEMSEASGTLCPDCERAYEAKVIAEYEEAVDRKWREEMFEDGSDFSSEMVQD